MAMKKKASGPKKTEKNVPKTKSSTKKAPAKKATKAQAPSTKTPAAPAKSATKKKATKAQAPSTKTPAAPAKSATKKKATKAGPDKKAAAEKKAAPEKRAAAQKTTALNQGATAEKKPASKAPPVDVSRASKDGRLLAVFEKLKEIMQAEADKFVVAKDELGNYSLESTKLSPSGQPLWFGGVTLKKRYVSYHLMPVHTDPRLLRRVPVVLKNRMEGKSCFNFKKYDKKLFEELADLTHQASETWKHDEQG